MNATADLIVVGGGPAGTAAGIVARKRGLRVVLLEARRFPRHRPGETLHPGVEPILRQLGVLEAVKAISPLRPEAQTSAWGGESRTVPYGCDERGTWRAFQVMRNELDQILLDRFVALGGDLVQPSPRLVPILEHGRVGGVCGDGLQVRAPVTIDASGAAGFLRRALGISLFRCSPRLIAHYGYRRGVVSAIPKLSGDTAGWAWIAQVAPDLVSWTRLDIGASAARPSPPEELAHLPEVGKRRAADVTWRMAHRLAGPGYFMAGEAAAVLDPAASHGVLRALMSGMMAGYGAANIVSRTAHPELAAGTYASWLGSWFWNDVDALRALYERVGVSWRASSLPSSTQPCRA